MEKQREFPTYKMLKTCSLGWRCEITSFCSGEIKTKAPIIIYHGGGGGKNEGGITWFSGEQRGGRNIIYIVTGPKHGKACMDGGTQKNK